MGLGEDTKSKGAARTGKDAAPGVRPRTEPAEAFAEEALNEVAAAGTFTYEPTWWARHDPSQPRPPRASLCAPLRTSLRALLCALVLAAALAALAPAQLSLAPAASAQPRAATPGPLTHPAVLQAMLTASDGGADDEFGGSVAIDGDTALIGAAYKTVDGVGWQGAAYVFTRSGSTWTQQAILTASDGAESDAFGCSVALDGDTALVGAFDKTVGGVGWRGAAYVFTRSGSTWTQQAALAPSDGAYEDHFGKSVALEGDTALVGAYGKDVNGNDRQGAAYVFTRSGATWTQQQEWTGSDGAAGDWFGYSIALDGDTALVGARQKTVSGVLKQGAAYVFTRNGATWAQQDELLPDAGAGAAWFGCSVALAGDTAMVGASQATVGGNAELGAAYFFTRSGSAWTRQAEITGSDTITDDWFGWSVALAGDTALVGAVAKPVGDHSEQGVAYVFKRSGSAWTQQEEMTGTDGATFDFFGSSVALSGKTAVIGADGKALNGNRWQGAAYVFALPCTVTPSVVNGHGTISPGTAQTFDWGATPRFDFDPDAGYGVRQVTVDGAPVAMTAANAYTFPALTADHAISVAFAPTPALAGLTPKAGRRGAVVTLRGSGFGERREASYVAFGKVKVTKYLSWSTSKIRVKVPGQARFGTNMVTVTTATGTSPARSFNISRTARPAAPR